MNEHNKSRMIDVTRKWIECFEKDLAALEQASPSSSLLSQVRAVQVNSLKSQLKDLRDDLARLEKS